MDRDEIIRTIRTHEDTLKRQGVKHVSLFGSMVRGKSRTGSDIDFIIELEPTVRINVFDYAGIVDYIQSLFPQPVDVANREMLKPHVRPSAERDAVAIF